jgi:hypothetical protein
MRLLALRRGTRSATVGGITSGFADDPDTSSSRLETDAGALEATAARHSHRQEQYLAASSFLRLRPQ